MLTDSTITTAEQYYRLRTEQQLRMMHAALLFLIQHSVQTQAATFTLLELMASKLPIEEKRKLKNTELDPEPIPAIQRKIEELQQQLGEDLRNGLYNLGL